jgi:teichuronic acid exporter
MNSIKEKTIKGLFWSFIDSFSSQAITFIVGIILARLLDPQDFGLIGMITVFIAVSQTFIDSGFSQALIRKEKCSEKDFSTVFYFNIIAGIIFFCVLFSLSPLISGFFNEPKLLILIRVLSFVLIIDSLTIIQRTTLTKLINFKLQTKISIVAVVVGGGVGIATALTGWGVWSLVFKTLSQRFTNSILLWVWNRWRPRAGFSKTSFKDMFGFGSKLLISGLLDTLYKNVYYFIIGKYFSAKELGFYTRADQFQALPSSNIDGIISKVSYPVLAGIQNDPVQLKAGYKRLLTSTMLITFVLMIGMAAVAEPLLITLIGEKWRAAIIYLQLLCFVGMMYPLHALNLNILKVKGRSDLFLRLEIIKKSLAIPVIFIGIFYGIIALICSMFVLNIAAYFLNSMYSARLIGYPVKEQLLDIFPSFFIAILAGIFTYCISIFLPFDYFPNLVVLILCCSIFVIGICELVKLKEYIYIKNIIVSKYKEIKREKKT